MAGLWICSHPSPRTTEYTLSLATWHSNCLWWSFTYISIKYALFSHCMRLPFFSSNFIFFVSLNVLIPCERTKNSLINLALLLLSIRTCVLIPATLALNTRCLPSIFDILSHTAYVEILTHLIASPFCWSTIPFVCCFWSRIWLRTMRFPHLIQSLWCELYSIFLNAWGSNHHYLYVLIHGSCSTYFGGSMYLNHYFATSMADFWGYIRF